ncbi:MAG: hypothetical protein QOF48_186 [Verrucomicrobiota bacterium]|jgi:hypothetical protein
MLGSAFGQTDSTPAHSESNHAVKMVSPGLFEIGMIRLDQGRRTVTFPAVVNLREGALEYLLVTSQGKTHESLLRTEARPRDIHIAMLLLNAKGAATNSLPDDPLKPLPGDRVMIDIAWKKKSKPFAARAETFVQERRTKTVMKPGVWIYTGSRLREDGFAADADGSIISLITDPDALINNPRPGREDDDNWLAKPGRLPASNEPVEVILTLEPPGPRP